MSFQIIIALFSKRLTLKQDSMPPNTSFFITIFLYIFICFIVLSFA